MSIEYIVKRDDRKVKFNYKKITKAIQKAADAVAKDNNEEPNPVISEQLTGLILQNLNKKYGNLIPTVEDVQKETIDALMADGHYRTAEKYILYRESRSKVRDRKTALMKKIEEVTFVDAGKSNLKRDNANIDGNTAMGQMLQYGAIVSKQFTDDNLLRGDIEKAVKNADIYLHDKDFFPMGTPTCSQLDLHKLFSGGFDTGHGNLREPQDIMSYGALAAIAIQANQNDNHGGQSIPMFDYYLAEGVKKTFKKLYIKNLAYIIEDVIDENYENEFKKLLNDIDIRFKTNEKEIDIVVNKILRSKFLLIDTIGDISLENLISRARKRTDKETIKKTYQTMEAFVHNLNTMHCLPSFQKIWVIENDEIKLLSIEEIYNNFEKNKYKVLSFNKTKNEYEWKYIVNCINNGKRDKIVKTITKKGQHIYTTDNHRFIIRTEDDFLTEGYPMEIHEVLLAKDFDSFGKTLPAVSLDHYHSRKKQNYLEDHIPLTHEFSELLGYYVANGSVVGGSQLCFTTCDEEIRNRIIEIMKNIYGKDITYKDCLYDIDKYKETRFNVGKVWTDCFKDICGNKSSNKCIPSIILQNINKEYLVKFLESYFICDARCSYYIEASTVSERLINDLNFAILSLGEIPYITKRNNLFTISLGGKASKKIGLEKILTRDTEYEQRKDNKTSLPLFAVNSTSEYVEYNGFVYDIEVEDNANFVVDSGILVHNSRAGAQVPFSSVNFGTDTSEEGRLVSEQLMLAQESGLGNGETPIFPILIFKVKDGINFNEGEPNYDLFKIAIRVSAKRLFPNFVFIDAPFNLQYYKAGQPETEIATMGCRTRVMGNVNGEETCIGRGNLSFNTINLPRLGIKYGVVGKKQEFDKEGFFKDFDKKIDLCLDALLERYEVQKNKKVKNFPFCYGQGVWKGPDKLQMEDVVGDTLNQGSLSVGFIGLAECLTALIGEHHGESQKAQELGLEIISHLRKRMDEATEKYHLNFSVLATPAEGLSGFFTRLDRKKYGVIKNVTDRDYYTNSNHIPVYYKTTAFNKIQKEAPYHALCNAGHIAYVELDGDPVNNLEAFEAIIRCMKESGVGYGSINHPIDRDPVCGYTGVINGDICPCCGRDMSKKIIDTKKITRL